MRGLLCGWLLLAAAFFCTAVPSAQQTPPSPVAAELALRLVALPTAAERQALLEQYPTLVEVGLVRTLISDALRLIDATDGVDPSAVEIQRRLG